jgi:hypothetical protein
MTELGEGVDGDEGGLDDSVVDHERRVLQRFGGGDVEGV